MNQSIKSNNSISVEQLIKTIPLLALLLLILGYVKLYAFYYLFHIDITSYIEIKDLSLVIPPDLISLLSIGSIFLVFIGFIDFSTLKSFQTNHDRIPKSESDNKKVRNRTSLLIVNIVFGVLYLVTIIYLLNSGNRNNRVTGIGSIILLSIIVILINNFQSLTRSFGLTRVFLIAFCLFLSIVLCLGTVTSTEMIKQGRYNGSIIYTKNGSYVSKDSLLYIGKTSSFLFLVNKYDNSHIVIPMNDIIRLEIKK